MNMKDKGKRAKKGKTKRILVTGGTGFVGKVLVENLSKSYSIRVFARKNAVIKNAEIFVGNLLDEKDVEKSLEGMDIVIHLAAMMSGNEKEIYSFNIKSTENLVNASIKGKIKKFIFLSSENAMWPGQSAYGESKKRCEEIVKKLNGCLILRSSAIYGKGSSIILGKAIDYVKKSKIIAIPGNGKSLMQPIYIEDVADYIINGVKYNAKGTYTIAGSSKISFNEFVDTAAGILKVKRIKIHIPLWIIFPIMPVIKAIFKNPPIKPSQIKNLNTTRTYDIGKAVKGLKHIPLKIKEGLKKTLI